MRPYILPGDIGHEGAVPEQVGVQDEASLTDLGFWSEPFAAQEESQFHRHIKAGQVRPGIQRDRRKIVNAELALLNDPFDLRQAKISGIVLFKRTSRDKPEIVYRENDCVEHRAIGGVEGTVDKDVITFQI